MHLLLQLKKHFLIITIVLAYVIADTAFTYHEIYWFNLLPFLLFVVYIAIAHLNVAYFLVIALTPVSIQLLEYFPSLPFSFSVPTEPLLFGIMLLIIYRSVQTGILESKIIKHPVTIAIAVNLFWMTLTAVTSVMPVVSFKFLLARMWFIAVYYFLAIMVFRNTRNISIFIGCYTLPMLIVIFYTINRHLGYGLFDKNASHFVMNPFFRDHTSYGAILAMLFFALGGVIIKIRAGLAYKIFLYGIWFFIAIALLLSYSRAAWISVILSLGVLSIILFKIRLRYILVAGMLVVLYLTGQRTEIVRKMERNRQASSASIREHVQSISNITTDESNLERINRWNSALRMFRERPVFGWGPGTYMFKYAPFQLVKDKTGISTNFGDLGNAHSEYIGPLAEGGIIGSLSFIIIGIMSMVTGFSVYTKLTDKKLKRITLGLLLGFITYLIHGTLNNFLDTDKASALFWGFSAVFVSLNISLKELNSKD
jgi:putative inorganic carbon (hco3(-)) transporter